MKYRKLSPTGDYTFGSGLRNFYIDEPAAPGQAVVTRLRLWRGEWSFDLSAGTPYMDAVLNKSTQQQADQTIQAQILGTEGVTNIQKYESDYDTEARALSVRADIDTIYGPTTVELQNLRNY